MSEITPPFKYVYKVIYKGEPWNYFPEGTWMVYEEGLSNGQLERAMKGSERLREVLREGLHFTINELTSNE